MPEVWYPRARRNPGAAAGYTRGTNAMRAMKAHYTVGVNSDDLIRREGLAQFLVTRAGEVIQYAEVDALCWDSGEWNDQGPGVEIEYYEPQDGDVIFTDAARDATAELVHWLHDTWGVPEDYYDGPRIQKGTWTGWISHRSLIQTQQHSDYWPQADWDAMVRPAPVPVTPPQEDPMAAALNYNGQLTSFYVNTNGDVCEKWYDGSAWKGAVLAQGGRVGAEVSIVRGWDNNKDRLDLFVEADKGGVLHCWYIPGQAFASELL